MPSNEEKRIMCPYCEKPHQNDDAVYLDIINTVIHQKCYPSDGLTIKDRGTYREILEKYEFFHELL